MHFTYVAKKISGEETKGVLNTTDRFDLAKILREQGYFLVSCQEVAKKSNFLSSFSILGRVSISEKMFFSRNLSIMVLAGISISRALDILSRQTRNKKFKNIINNLSESIKKGNSLSESMKSYPRIFQSFFVAMVKVGEETGRLGESLQLVGEQLERDHMIIKKVRGAFIYPGIIVSAMILIGILMLIYVVPTLVSTFKELGAELPLSTRIIIGFSEFLMHYPLVIIGAFIFIAFIFILFFRSRQGKILLDNIFLHLPFFSGLVKKVNSARTTRTFSSLISAGVDVLEALSITKDVLQNHNFKNVLERAKDDIQKGTAISESFKKASNIYPILVGEMMAVGEETGKMPDMLLRLATFYEEEVAETTKNLSTIVEPLLMIVIGAFVGFFAVSMVKPMYSMVSNL